MAGPPNATSTGSGRVYKWGDEKFTSVTTILGGGVPKPALTGWAARTVAEFAVKKRDAWQAIADVDERAAIDMLKGAPWRDRDKASNKGTAVHDLAEKASLGEELGEVPKEIEGHVNSMLKFRSEWGLLPEHFLRTEATVYNRTYGYAGTFDFMLIGNILGDWKTNRSGIFPETALQLAGYRNAEFIGLPNGTELPMPEVSECWAVHLAPRSYKVIPLDTGKWVFDRFLAALEIHRWTSVDGREAVGAPLAPPKEGEMPWMAA